MRISDRRNRRPCFNRSDTFAPEVLRVESEDEQSEHAYEVHNMDYTQNMVPAVISEPIWSPMFSPPVCDVFSLEDDDSKTTSVSHPVPTRTTELRKRRQTKGVFSCTSQPRQNFRQ